MILLITFNLLYKAGHSCETALVRVYYDIVITIGRSNAAKLVLFDLSDALQFTMMIKFL